MKSSICVLKILTLCLAAALLWPLAAIAQVHVTALSASSSASAHGDPAPYPFGGLPIFMCDQESRGTPPLTAVTSGTVSLEAFGCIDAVRHENAYSASGGVHLSYLGDLTGNVTSFDLLAAADVRQDSEFVSNFSGSGSAGFSATFTLDEPAYVKVYTQQRSGGAVSSSFPAGPQGQAIFAPAGTYTVSGSAGASLGSRGSTGSQAEIYLEFDVRPRRPVLLIPGIGATFSKDRDLDLYWLASRGLHPDFLQIDPLSKAYDDLIQTMKDAGYVEGHNLFIVNYDWRLMPGPIDGAIDGAISGLSASSISDTTFQYGVDYLGFYLRKAAEAWAVDHPDQPPLTSVDIVAHSTGGLVARTYIQSGSGVYGGDYDFGVQLPKVEHLVMVGVPNRGASKAWNPLHDEWGTDPTFQFVLSKIVNRAFNYVDKGGTISGPDHVITTALLNSSASCPEGPKVCFIKMYIPTARALLATYDFLDLGSGPTNVNADANVRNSLILDLNAGLDDVQVGDANAFADNAQVTAIYGTNGGMTPTQAIQEQVTGSGVPAVSFSDVVARTLTSGTYYRDVIENNAGDGTVPLESSIGQFLFDSRVTLLPFSKGGNTTHSVGHVDLMSNPEVQAAILHAFGLADTTPISTNLHSAQYTTALCAASGAFCGNIQIDPVEGFLVDGLGRRLGYTTATGRLEEIPGSIWFGTTDGIGWVRGPLEQPLTLRLTGLGGPYRASVSVVSGAGTGGAAVDGALSIGARRDVPIVLSGGGGDDGGGGTPTNTAPVAEAGGDQHATVGDIVHLDGAASLDADGNPLTFQWSFTSVPAGSAAALTNPAAVQPTFSPDVPGTYVAQLIVNDGTVNSGPDTATITVIAAVDHTAPTAVLDAPSAIDVGADLVLSGSGSSDVGGHIVSYRWQLDANPVVVTSSPSFTFTAAGNPLTIGLHTLALRVVDDSGNVSEADTKHVLIGDNIAPTAIITAPNSINAGADLTVSGASSSDVGGRVVQYEWRLDAFGSIVSPDPAFTFSNTSYPLAVGHHTVTLNVVDDSGNTSSPATHDVIVRDTIAPTAVITAPNSINSGADLTVSGASSSDVGGRVVQYMWQLDAFGSIVSPDPAFTFSNASYPLAVGHHTLMLTVQDDSGNTSSPATHDVLVRDTIAPTAVITAPNSISVGANLSVSGASSSDVGGRVVQYRWQLDAFGEIVSSDPSFTFTAGAYPLAAGTHTLTLRVVDDSGNTSSPAALGLQVLGDVTPPDTTITSGPSGTIASTSATFTFTSSEAGSTFQCQLDGAGFGACPVSYTGLAQGSHVFSVRAIDAAGNVDQTPATRSFTVSTDTVPPDTTIKSGPGGLTSTAFTAFGFAATEPATFECRLDGPGATTGAYQHCGSPKVLGILANGAYTFLVRATDAAGNVDQTPAFRSFTIDTAAPDTSITSGPSGPTNMTSWSFAFTSTEPGSTFECRLDGPGFTAGTTRACIPGQTYGPLAEGIYLFRVRATDAAGNDDLTPATRTFIVDTTPPDTAILVGPSGNTTNLTPTFAFLSGLGTTFECRLDGPLGAGTFQSCPSPFQLAPLAKGAYTFRVRAIDAAGNVDPTPAIRTFTER